jgi:hypothetical protein
MPLIAIKESGMAVAMNDLNRETDMLHLKQRHLIGMAPLITLPTQVWKIQVIIFTCIVIC